MTTTFSIIRFSPNPEEIEYINIAILLQDEEQQKIIYDPAFPRIRNFLPNLDINLNSLMRDFKKTETSQIQILNSRNLVDKINPTIEKILISRYLQKHPY